MRVNQKVYRSEKGDFNINNLTFEVADKYNIIDKPNQRSSHNYITLRGGGIVFWKLALLNYSLLSASRNVFN
jgi:hypothetical protein